MWLNLLVDNPECGNITMKEKHTLKPTPLPIWRWQLWVVPFLARSYLAAFNPVAWDSNLCCVFGNLNPMQLSCLVWFCNHTGTLKATPLGAKVKTYWFGSAKWFWPSIFSQFAEAGKIKKGPATVPPAVDWLDSFIGSSWVAIDSLPTGLQSQF